MKKCIAFLILLWSLSAYGKHLDVVDLRDTPEKKRLLVLSLQGNVNRDSACLYIIWEDIWHDITPLPLTPSERWLEYYQSKSWITYDTVSLDSALSKYRDDVKGYIIYDPDFRHSINIAFTMAGIDSAIVAHPDYINKLDSLGISELRDLRGMWTDQIEAYTWQRDSLFPYCNTDMIAMMTIHWWLWECGHPQKDYVIENRACVVDLSPNPDDTEEYELLKTYYEQMNPFGIVLGWPEVYIDPVYEAWHVHLASKYNLMLLHERYDAVNYSVHSKMPADTVYHQLHCDTVSLDTTKIYCTFTMIDGGGDMMQNRFYNAWDDPMRGSIPLNWYFEPVFRNHCPGIYQHYYETKTDNDYFIAGFGLGYIYPTDFPLLGQYLNQSKSRMDECDLKALALINGFRMDEEIISAYTSTLNNFLGFTQGYTGTELGWINTGNFRVSNNIPWVIPAPIATGTIDSAVAVLDSVANSFNERPLFLCSGAHLFCFNVDSIRIIMERLNNLHPGELKFVKLDEFMLALRAYWNLLCASEYLCDSLSIVYGTIVSGDKNSLSADDGQYLVIDSKWWIEYCTDFYTYYNVDEPRDSIKRIWVTYDGHSSEDSTFNYLYIWNYSSSEWDLIGWRIIGAQDFTQEDGITHNAGDYISGSNQIKLRVFTTNKHLFTNYADYLRLEIFRKKEVGIDENAKIKVQNVKLVVHPNPFNAITNIIYNIPQLAKIDLAIYNICGQKITTLDKGLKQSGEYTIDWNAKDFPCGIYFCKLKVGDKLLQVKKFILLK